MKKILFKSKAISLQNILAAFFILVYIFCISCERQSEGSRKEGEHIHNTVKASVETDPVPQAKNADAADDPAIWINHKNPAKSVVYGTDKRGGIASYDLNGKQLNYYPYGKMNNCDIRYNFPLNNEKIDILACSNRSSHSISLFKISEGGVLDSIHSGIITCRMKGEVYGLCMYNSPVSEKYYVFINSKAGEVEQWELFENEGKVDANLVRSFNLDSQTEGMVADDKYSTVYIGKEIDGIWKFDAEPNGNNIGKYINNSSAENKNIRYDIEGLAVYKTEQGNGYLIASSQGNYSYAVFERQGNNKYLGSFRIVDGEIDGVEETDGIEITNFSLGKNFPAGMLVVQDGYNYDEGKKRAQNFKYISWEHIETLLITFSSQ